MFSIGKCPICGGQMAHYRLRGYQCHIEGHNTDRREMERRGIERWLGIDRPDDWETIILKEMGVTSRAEMEERRKRRMHE